MRNNRIIIVSVVVLGILFIGTMLYNAASPPASNEKQHDSFGIKSHGLRGFFEFLEELNIPISRSFIPPHAAFHRNKNTTLVVWHPDEYWLSIESNTLEKLNTSLGQGGRAIIGLPFNWFSQIPRVLVQKEVSRHSRSTGEQSEHPVFQEDSNVTIPETVSMNATLDAMYKSSQRAVTFMPRGLGISNLETHVISFVAPEPHDYEAFSLPYGEIVRLLVPDWRWALRFKAITTVPIIAGGDFLHHTSDIKSLSVPSSEIQVLSFNATNTNSTALHPVLRGTLSIQDVNGTQHIIAARYSIGEGECIIVSEPAIFMNTLLDKADNAALAATIIHPGEDNIVLFDEFFNGLSVRGNPLWLFVQAPYGQITLALMLCVAIFAWRASPRLGPALDPEPVNRRAIDEYVDAMASLFFRGNRHKYLLVRVKEGVIWSLRRTLRLSLRGETPEAIYAALVKKDPTRAEQFLRGLHKTDPLLHPDIQPTESEMVDAAREITSCL